MSAHSFKRFKNVTLLRRFNFELLLRFLAPWREYLYSRHGFQWSENFLQFPFQQLVDLLAEPDDGMPELLHTALFFIDELATPKVADAIRERLHESEHKVPGNIAAEDLALYAWLADPSILQSLHSELAASKPRRFERSYSKWSAWPDTSKDRLIALEDALNDWFDSLNKGRGVQVMAYQRDGTVSLHLRHGELLKRDCALKNNGMTRRIVYRPERYDFADYTPGECELKIHAETQREKAIYRKLIGKFCFGDENFFLPDDGKDRFTLEPIREYGRDALVCSDVDGLEWARLKELHTVLTGRKSYTEVFKSEHCLFDDWEDHGKRFREDSVFIRATFQIRVAGLVRPRSLTVCTPNVTIYDRSSSLEGLFTQWLKNRRFSK